MGTELPMRKVTPDELTAGFQSLGLRAGDRVMMHGAVENFGTVEGGAAMVLHRLLGVLGKEGTLLMPTFTSLSRHSVFHENFTKPDCWCEGIESRHVPFISELQPDRELGNIAHRLCSWPDSTRSRHPAYSFVAVGKHRDEVISQPDLLDPLLPIKRFLKRDPKVLTAASGFDSITAIHLAEERKSPGKFAKERALTVSSKGQVWVDIKSIGCSRGYERLREHIPSGDFSAHRIGLANVQTYMMNTLIQTANSLLEKNTRALSCSDPSCLSCNH